MKSLSLLVVLIAILALMIGTLAYETLSPSTSNTRVGRPGTFEIDRARASRDTEAAALAAAGSLLDVVDAATVSAEGVAGLVVTKDVKLPAVAEPTGDSATPITLMAALVMLGAAYALRRRLAW